MAHEDRISGHGPGMYYLLGKQWYICETLAFGGQMTIRRTVLSSLACILLFSGLAFFRWISTEAGAVSIQLNVKDLPEYGLRLVPSTDSSFQGRLSSMLGDKGGNLPAEGLKAYSVLFENQGKKAVVGYRLKWEMANADGAVSVRQAGETNTGAFVDEGQTVPKAPLVADGAVKPGSAVFVSLLGSLREADSATGGGTISAYAGGSADPADLNRLRQRAQETPPSLEDTVIADLQSYISITISVDGAFFEDGTFVGPDTTGFFAVVEAEINARRDIIAEIAFAVQRNRNLDEIFSYIEELGGSPLPDRKLNKEDLYNLLKKVHAEEILRMRSAMGGQRALDVSLREYRRAWPRLKKL